MGRPKKHKPDDAPSVVEDDLDTVAAPVAVESTEDNPSVNVTWLGEDDLHEGDGPSSNTWRGIIFPKGEPVPVSNPAMIEKAKNNRFYSVEE